MNECPHKIGDYIQIDSLDSDYYQTDGCIERIVGLDGGAKFFWIRFPGAQSWGWFDSTQFTRQFQVGEHVRCDLPDCGGVQQAVIVGSERDGIYGPVGKYLIDTGNSNRYKVNVSQLSHGTESEIESRLSVKSNEPIQIDAPYSIYHGESGLTWTSSDRIISCRVSVKLDSQEDIVKFDLGELTFPDISA